MTSLFVLVDLQQDYLKSRELHPAAGSVVHRATALLAFCRCHGITIAHVWTTVSREPDNRMPHLKDSDIWRCEQGTAGHQTPLPLAPLEGELVFHKTGFNLLASPNIVDLARQRAIDTVILAGLKTHACVRQLALDAWQAGLGVWIASEAIASDEPLHAAITRRYLQARGVDFFSTAELTQRLGGQTKKFAFNEPVSVRPLVAASRSAFNTWRSTKLKARSDCVRNLCEILTAQVDTLPILMADEIGKPVRFGRAEVQHSLQMLLCMLQRTENAASQDAAQAGFLLRRRPHGTVAVITPWNNPIYIPLGKIVPAILCGNSVVWKPAPEASRISRHLFNCLMEAGWPERLVSLLEGGRREAEFLMNDDDITAVTITGSSEAGYTAQEICARRRLPLQAELGGNNAAIVWPDADLRVAARMVAAGAFEMAGQRCTANRRAIVHQTCIRAFVSLLSEEIAALKWGDPLDIATDIGPLVNMAHHEEVAAAVDRAVTNGCLPLLPHGDVPQLVEKHAGKFYPPTIICCDDPKLEIVQEETFGPVLVVQTAQDWGHALELCNGVRQGLAVAIFTTSEEIVAKFLDEAEAGILKVNQSTAGAAVDAPFGGWKASGVGLPEHGRFDIEFFTRPQTVYGAR